MRKIVYFDKSLDVDEYVRIEILKNGGTKSIAFKGALEAYCEELGISYDSKKSTKCDLLDLILEAGISYETLAQKYGIGVSSQVYQKTFGITHDEVKKLEKKKLLKVVGDYRFRAYGKYLYAPLYDIYQYAHLSDKEMKELLLKTQKNKRPG